MQSADDYAGLQGVEVVRVNNDITFLSAPRLEIYILEELLPNKSDSLKSIVLDFLDVKTVDISGLKILKVIAEYTHKKGVTISAINISEFVDARMKKYNVPFDHISVVSGISAISDDSAHKKERKISAPNVVQVAAYVNEENNHGSF